MTYLVRTTLHAVGQKNEQANAGASILIYRHYSGQFQFLIKMNIFAGLLLLRC
jgi:hypothetical protein